MKDKLEEILKIYEDKHLNFYYIHSKDELEEYKKN